jgi:NADPH2:quinone reductase
MMVEKTMRAAVIEVPGPPEVLQIKSIPVPEPGPGAARLEVAWVGMNPVDTMVRRERLEWMPVSYPLVAGLEHTGIVDAVGEGVDPGLVGRRVLSRSSFGGYADYACAPAESLIHLDDRIDLRTGCAYRGCSFTAWHALHLCARLRAGDNVLVHSAAGAIGIMAMQMSRDTGARPVGLAGGDAKLRYASELTNCAVVDYLDEGWPARALEANDGCRFDVILDGNGGPNARHNTDLIAPLGRIVYIGATAGSYPDPVPVPALIAGSFSVGGMTLTEVELDIGSEADLEVTERVASGQWQVPITEEVALEEIADLHLRLERRSIMGRAVVRISGQL